MMHQPETLKLLNVEKDHVAQIRSKFLMGKNVIAANEINE